MFRMSGAFGLGSLGFWGDQPPGRAGSVLAFTLLLFLLAAGPVAAQPTSTPGALSIPAGGEEATVVADQLQQVGGASDLMIAIGNVEIVRGQTRLLADRVEINRDTGQAIAQGKVVFYDGPDRLVGERIDYNLKTGTGVVYQGSAVSAPFYHLRGERMDRSGESIYEVRRGVFTTCEGDDPPWSFRFGSGNADLDDMVWGRDASFWVKNVPILPWVPFFAAALRKERQSGFLFPEFGQSSRLGYFMKLPFYWAISDSQDLTVSLDPYSARGIGLDTWVCGLSNHPRKLLILLRYCRFRAHVAVSADGRGATHLGLGTDPHVSAEHERRLERRRRVDVAIGPHPDPGCYLAAGNVDPDVAAHRVQD